jgi:putative flippase GtrA
MWRSVRVSARSLSPGVVRRFVLVGGTACALYFAISWLLVSAFGIGQVIATSIAFAIVIAWNYLLHYHWTFRSARAHSIAGLRFGVMSAVGFLLNWSAVSVGLKFLPKSPFLVKMAAVGLVVLFNLVMSSLWVFGDKRRVTDRTGRIHLLL